MTDPRPATPIGFALGFSLAFAASVGIFAAYWLGHGAPVQFWLVLAASLVVGFGLGSGVQRFALPDNTQTSASQESSSPTSSSTESSSTESSS